jgi:hypothetical protein
MHAVLPETHRMPVATSNRSTNGGKKETHEDCGVDPAGSETLSAPGSPLAACRAVRTGYAAMTSPPRPPSRTGR